MEFLTFLMNRWVLVLFRTAPPCAVIAFSEISDYYLASLRDRGRLRTEVTDRRRGEFRWYVLQNRAGLLTPLNAP
jgi:hypothetical protein